MRRILYNAIKTPDGKILESFHTHDFKSHRDKKGNLYQIDGGVSYLKRAGDFLKCEELSVYDSGEHSLRREWIHWGVNYDENMKQLPNTNWVKVKDLSTDHIYNILKLSYIDEFYRRVFEDEIIYRCDEYDG